MYTHTQYTGGSLCNKTVQSIDARKSVFGARKSVFGARKSVLGARKSVFGARKSVFTRENYERGVPEVRRL